MTEEEFREYMERMRQGDKQALHAIYEAYIAYVYTIIYRMVQNKEDAEDITSDFFLKLWNLAEQYKPGNGHKAYMATIARNMTIDFMRKHKREILTNAMQEDDINLEGNGSTPNVSIPVKQRTAKENVEDEVIENVSIQQALQQLSEPEREVVHLKVIGEMTFQDIATMLQIPMGTITWRYQNAIKKLRRCGYEQGF